jgi:hypothetical protein
MTSTETTEEIETVGLPEEEQNNAPPAAVYKVNAKNIFHHPDAHPIALDLLLIRKYDLEWLSWEPETFDIRISQDYKTSLSEVNFHKMNAVKALHLVDTFWERWEVFLWCTMALNGVIPDFQSMQVPTVAMCLVSVDIANRIRTDVTWSEEIKHFIEAIYRHDGIFCPQAPADFLKVDSENLVVDCADVSAKWAEVRRTKRVPDEESVTAEQLRRLLLVHGFLEESRAHLKHQLSLVPHVTTR